MSNTCEYENESELAQHADAMHGLARDLGLAVQDIRGFYEEILCNIKDGARIKDFLVILASRNVKDLVRRGLIPGE